MKKDQALTATERALVAAARRARLRAHAPYSGFKVGAALRTRDGRVFAGCNVENASLGAGICAERGAVMQAVAAGMRPAQLASVAIFTGDARLTPPCGMCLQVLVEFGRDVHVILAAPGRVRRTSLAALYPEPFTEIPAPTRRRR
jgi:cytidine deaminase